VHRIKVGSVRVTVLSDGRFTQPLGLMLPGRGEAEVQALFSRQGASFGGLEADCNVAILDVGGERILVDAGAGPDFMPTLGRLADRLQAASIAPDSIAKVVFTHAHADHLWGALDPLGGGALFEKARHMISDIERDFWLAADVETRVADAFKPMAVGTRRRLKELGERIETVKAGAEISPGVALVETAGHTPGHLSVHVRSGGEQLMIIGDALVQGVISFAAPEWRWGSDIDPDRAVVTRRTLLDRLARERISLLGTHLPWPGVGHVERKDSAYRLIAA
jgi:glyoxylase-like metal-dependent hydrolase (beta-lactamase superfamily II)